MEEKLPHRGLKETPHIESRVKLLKNHYNGIREIQMESSGIGWDDELKMVKCDELTFDEWANASTLFKCLFILLDLCFKEPLPCCFFFFF